MWDMYPMIIRHRRMNLEKLQDHVGLLDTNKGVVHLSLYSTDLYELLSKYIESVDYNIYYNHSHRILLEKYHNKVHEGNMTYLYKAIYYALKAQQYNLAKLIESTEIDYEPLDSYALEETIHTTGSIARNMKFDTVTNLTTSSFSAFDVETKTDYGDLVQTKEIDQGEKLTTNTRNFDVIKETTGTDETFTKGTETHTHTNVYGEQTNNTESSVDYGAVTDNTTETTNIGARSDSTNTEQKNSPYNTDTYVPYANTDQTNNSEAATDTKTTEKTVTGRMDTTTGNEVKASHEDNLTEHITDRIDTTKGTDTKTVDARVDTELIKTNAYVDTDTYTTQAHTDTAKSTTTPKNEERTSRTDPRSDSERENESTERIREVHGRYGYNPVQTMIQAERDLANLNIVEKIIDIILPVICEGVLFTC